MKAYSRCGRTVVLYGLTDTCMFSFDVTFNKTQRFISVRADSVYMCVEILIGGQFDNLPS